MADPVRAPGRLLPLRLIDVSFRVGGRTIVDRVSAVLDAGPRTVILGANGAGKSVLMRLVHGLLAPSEGRIVWTSPEHVNGGRRQAMVFQRPVMLRRSALANIDYALAVAHMPPADRDAAARKALAEVGLAHRAQTSARVLSGGEQQRLALARAWALRPEVLFLDEPTASLDPGASAEVERIIQAIHESGTKIIMTTHNLGQARRLGDEILFLHEGRLVERAPADRFFARPRTPEAVAFLKGELPWI